MSARQRLIDSLLARARIVADAAGQVLLSDRPDCLAVSSKSDATDIVTDMDRRSESLIVDRLLDGRPEDGILAEEGSKRESASGVRWVIDPIDGTVNYLYRIPIWAVCIGVELDGEPVAGVVAAPGLGTTYSAGIGGPAVMSDSRGEHVLHVGDKRDLSLALVATGFGYSAERRKEQGEVLASLLPVVRDVRRAGTASVDLCWLAGGMVDAYYEVGLKPWDHAAAGVIARQAGARIEGQQGHPPGESLVIGANPCLFDGFRAALREAGLTA